MISIIRAYFEELLNENWKSKIQEEQLESNWTLNDVILGYKIIKYDICNLFCK